MLFQTLGQAQVFLCMVSWGAVCALLYDLLCLSQPADRRGAWLWEVLYALVSAALLFYAIARVQLNSLRAYVLLGGCTGWFLYLISVSRFLRWCVKKAVSRYRKKRKKQD